MFGKRKHSKFSDLDGLYSPRDYDQTVKAMFETSPQPIHHEQLSIPDDDDGLAFASCMKKHRWAFDYFAGFPKEIRKFHAPDEEYDCGPWQLQQLAEPYINMAGWDDGPVAGIRYRLFYNAFEIGEVEVEPQLGFGKLPKSHKHAAIHVSIENAPLVPYTHLRGFLHLCTSRFDTLKDREFRDDRAERIHDAILETLWESNREDSVWRTLYLYYAGAIDTRYPIADEV